MRTHVIQMWTDAAEYSGEMIQRRSSESRSIYLKNGQANTALFADDEPKAKPKRSVRYKIIPQQTRLDNIEKMQQELEEEYAEGAMSAREYAELSLVLMKKQERAYQLLAKAMGWKDELSQDADEQGLAPAYAWTEKPKGQPRQQEKDSIFLTLPVDNSFRRAYTWFQKAKNLFKG